MDDSLDRIDAYARDFGDTQLLAMSTNERARLLRRRGDAAREAALLEQALTDVDRSGMEMTLAQMAERLADLQLDQPRPSQGSHTLLYSNPESPVQHERG